MSWNGHCRFKYNSLEPIIFPGLSNINSGQNLHRRRGRVLMQGRWSSFLNWIHSLIRRKIANILAENTNLHIIHRHLHTEFKRLYLRVCKINSVIYCNCVSIQYPVHYTNETHNTFKDHIPEEGRWQSDEGSASVILPGSRACLVWLQCEMGKAATSNVLWGTSPPGWVSLLLESAVSELMVPRRSLCQGGKYAQWCLLPNPNWAEQKSHDDIWACWCMPLIPIWGRQRQAWLWVWGQPCLHSKFQASRG